MFAKENIPLRCPFADQCRRCSEYQSIVRRIKANQTYFLNQGEEIWKFVKNCPHKVEDAFWIGVLGEKDWLRYLTCEEFSRWFWERKACNDKRGKR
jgi:hypothetical protein